MSDTPRPQSLSRSTNHMGNIEARLRDLRGFATLAYELIQNADDAGGATEIRFDVRDDALVVDNDGVFTDCNHQDAVSCPWKEAGGHRCDFHRFREVSSGDKREEAGTTGAFGVGFVAVYQVTDHPELISAGQHWKVHDDKQRVEVCAGCSSCQAGDLPGTRFILPWARDAKSGIRKRLKVEAVTASSIEALAVELEKALPLAMPFLKRVRRAELRRNGDLKLRVEQTSAEGRIKVSGEGQTRTWMALRESFVGDAESLRQRHPELLDDKRTSNVTVAIPLDHDEDGLLYAVLPTQQMTGLPLHINADFYTSSDRKKVVFEHEYQSEWNRAAIGSAARSVRYNLPRLRELLAPKAFWRLLQAAEKVHAGEREACGFDSFWREVMPVLKQDHCVYTADAQWVKPGDACWFPGKDQSPYLGLLSGLGFRMVHDDLRAFRNILVGEGVEVPQLTPDLLLSALARAGLTNRIDRDARPDWLQDDAQVRTLWALLKEVFGQSGGIDRLGSYALVPVSEGAMVPCSDAHVSDGDDTEDLFCAIDPKLRFIAGGVKDIPMLAEVCPSFGVTRALGVLGRVVAASGLGSPASDSWTPNRLLSWFADRALVLKREQGLAERLAKLPVFPCGSGLRPLTGLAFPGDFTDPVGITDLLDMKQLGNLSDFIRDLGGRELTFSAYVSHYAPRAFTDKDVPAGKKRSLIDLLARKLSEFGENDEARAALRGVESVECEDGRWRCPSDVYIRTKDVEDTLESNPQYAAMPGGGSETLLNFFRWLGVAGKPRARDLVARVRELVAKPPSGAARVKVTAIFGYLGRELGSPGAESPEYAVLKEMAWLPARGKGSRWYKPVELYATFEDYVFHTQASFLDVPKNVESASRSLLDYLGVNIRPTVAMVVRHLQQEAARNATVHREVYRFLNENAEDAAVQQLRGKNCLSLGDRYVAPECVYWNRHPFGRFRYQLTEDLHAYGKLLGRLGVRKDHSTEDAIDVIRDISGEFKEGNRRLDDHAYSVLVKCWEMLSEVVDVDASISDRIRNRLGSEKVVPNSRHALSLPGKMYWEDRAGLATKFGGWLALNVVPRIDGMRRALEAAGVLSLAQSVTTEVVERPDPVEDESLRAVIRERASQVKRVLAAAPARGKTDMSVLDNLRCWRVRELKLLWRLSAFREVRDSELEEVSAHFDAVSSALYYVPHETGWPVPSIARELALALCPEAEPGQLASGLKEVLGAESLEEAEMVLGELGYVGVEALPDSGAVEPGVVDSLGGEGNEGPTVPPFPSDVDQAVADILGTDTPPPTPPPKSDGDLPRVKLRSYVSRGRGTGRQAPGTAPKEQRDRVDQAGVSLVMKHERQAGREPDEKEHNHPGYDIESKGPDGSIVRFIEVKSMSGTWNPQNDAPLSREQFKEAQKKKELYWLYVVERADSPEATMYRIQNPATRVDVFMFDDGWKEVAEPEPEEEQDGED
ncbi:DUF3883 domain-containing protein [candidate division WOR-3 bacterium]|nr:DUF3883 domain-containing protein [candidate division WOR-3 bacterium]